MAEGFAEINHPESDQDNAMRQLLQTSEHDFVDANNLSHDELTELLSQRIVGLGLVSTLEEVPVDEGDNRPVRKYRADLEHLQSNEVVLGEALDWEIPVCRWYLIFKEGSEPIGQEILRQLSQHFANLSVISIQEYINQETYGCTFRADLAKEKTPTYVCLKQAYRKRNRPCSLREEHKTQKSLFGKHQDKIIELAKLPGHERIKIAAPLLSIKYRNPQSNVAFTFEILQLDYRDGKPLGSHIREQPLDEEHLVAILDHVLTGLAFLADQNVIHCNIHPDTILYERTSKKALIIDLGVALRTDQVRQGRPCGKWRYRAPEVHLGQQCTGNGDLYSFGVTMAHLIMRRSPYHWISHDMTKEERNATISDEVRAARGGDSEMRYSREFGEFAAANLISENVKKLILALLHPIPEARSCCYQLLDGLR